MNFAAAESNIFAWPPHQISKPQRHDHWQALLCRCPTDRPKRRPSPAARLTKNYGSGNSEVQALRGVDLDVYPGELTLLVGPSGCGKTTLLVGRGRNSRSDRGRNGRAWAAGRPSCPSSRKVKFRRQNIGFVFQQFNLLPSLTGGRKRHRSAGACRLVAPQGHAGGHSAVGTDGNRRPDAARLPATLSGGQQQRVAIARRCAIIPGCWSATSRPRPSTARRATPSWSCCAARRWRAIGP